MKSYEKIDKNILKCFINSLPYEVEIYGVSVPECAFHLNTSIYQARKYMKQLEMDGFVKKITIKDTCSCYDSWRCECEATGLPLKKWVRIEVNEQ